MRTDIYRPFTSGTTTALTVNGDVVVYDEIFEDVETSVYSSRFLTRDGKILDVSTWGLGLWLVFEEA